MAPKKNPKKQSYSNTALIVGVGMITLVSVNLLLMLSRLCDEEEKGDLSQGFGGILPVLCPLFALKAVIGATFKDTQEMEGESCLGTLDGPAYLKYDGKLFHARNIDDVRDALSKNGGHLLQQFALKNTIFHFQVMNHFYDRITRIYQGLTEEERIGLCHAKDVNGRTPFFLSLAIGAPGNIQRLLATPENVMMVDNYGMKPLDMAALGLTNLKTTQYLLSLMSEEDLRADSEENYKPADRISIMKHLKKYSVNPNKASNFCTDTLNAGHKSICVSPKVSNQYQNTFYLDTVSIGGVEQACVIANKDNIAQLAVDMGYLPYKPQQMEAERLYPHVSDQSITDVIVKRQAKNIATIQKAITSAKNNEQPTLKK